MFTLPSVVSLCLLLQVGLGLPRSVLEKAPTKGLWGYSPDGKLLAATGRTGDDPLILYDVATGKVRAHLGARVGKFQHFGYATFTPDSKTLIGTSVNQPIRLWDVAKGEIRNSFVPAKGNIITVTFPGLGGKTDTFTEEQSGAGCTVVTPDGKTLIATAGKGLQFWDLEKKKLIDEIEMAGSYIGMLQISADGKRLAACEHPDRVTVYDVPTRKAICSWKTSLTYGRGMALSPDGKLLTVGGMIYNAGTGQEIESILKPRLGLRGELAFVFSPDSKTLAMGGGPVVWLYDVENHRFYATLRAGIYSPREQKHELVVNMAFSPDGKTLAVACDQDHINEGRIKLFDVRRPKD